MRTILYLVRKEFTQIFRNKFISKAIFGIPLVQMIILVPAVTFEIRNIKLCVIDKDMTYESRELISKLQGSEFFLITHSTFSENVAEDLLHKNKCDLIINIPDGFSREMMTGSRAKVMIIANAINASSAQLSWAYISGVLRDFNSDMVMKTIAVKNAKPLPSINITNRFWYNPTLNYRYYMLPGILVILVTAIGLLLAGLNVVKEKEVGTIEQLNVTPIKKYQFVVAKLVPFLLIGLADLAFGLFLGKILFNIPFTGSIALLFLFASIYLIAVLGLALFLSTFSSTQQQFLFVVFFILLIFILMSGIFTPAESMPTWAQKFNIINPAAYFMRVIRMIILKGSRFHDIIPDLKGLSLIALSTISLSIWMYRKRV